MLNRIYVNLEDVLGTIDRNIFGGFAEHMARCIYEGIYDPESLLADENGMRPDVLDALRRLRMPLIRYPGGNFVSGYNWRDGIGPVEERPTRLDLAWHNVETNRFGTNEFIQFCRLLGTEPFLVVNCGDGDLREARDWVEYCNGERDTTLTRLRKEHGFEAPHRVRYWGVGNEVDGHWQTGYKTPEEYTRAFTEFGKVMKWVDPTIKLVASGVSHWEGDVLERVRLLIEQAGDQLDYLDIHWYFNNRANDFAAFMTVSETIEERLSGIEGIIRGVKLDRHMQRDIPIAVGEWNVVYRTDLSQRSAGEEIYNLEDALVAAMHFNAFIRHARTVRMANIAQVVNMIAPIRTRSDGLVLQTIFYPFELYSTHCGSAALNVFWTGDTFSGGGHSGVRVLDVSATLDEAQKRLVLFVVNRSEHDAAETEIQISAGRIAGVVDAFTVTGADIKIENTFDQPDGVGVRRFDVPGEGGTLAVSFEPHSLTVLVCDLA
jgi:alpha-N-arabinofuranosidase